ncbi:hypothetical protein BV22DRAFT_1037656 [Leucogyrophana mollusca]|uniref:Uncharacterized protein n=1 Tax=Leucogyrophana mollusca TaxID=85980 RepID=A0ACB8B9B9_9AGAM|nr:hypothetical protein BV22DRAFT_1037656 [Leucogyrophana mollusca]
MLLKLSAVVLAAATISVAVAVERDIPYPPPPPQKDLYYKIQLYPGYNLSGKPENHHYYFDPPGDFVPPHECSTCMAHKYMTEKNAKHTGLYSFKYTTQDYHKGVSMNLRLYASADCKHELHDWTNSWTERWMPPNLVGAKSHKVCATY